MKHKLILDFIIYTKLSDSFTLALMKQCYGDEVYYDFVFEYDYINKVGIEYINGNKTTPPERLKKWLK